MDEQQRIHYGVVMPRPPDGVQAPEDPWIYLIPVPYDEDNHNDPYPTLPCPVAIRTARSEDGRLVCVGLRIGADAVMYPVSGAQPEITSTTLREVKLGQILRDLAQNPSGSAYIAAEVGRRSGTYAGEHAHPGRRGYPNAFYEGIRDLYREALQASPGRVYRYIVENARDAEGRLMYRETDEEAIELSRETVARKWVKTARRKGFLGKAIPGKAGELMPVSSAPEASHETEESVGDPATGEVDSVATPRDTNDRKEQP